MIVSVSTPKMFELFAKMYIIWLFIPFNLIG